MNELSVPGYYSGDTYTHSPPSSDQGRKKWLKRLTYANDTPPSSPASMPATDPEDADPSLESPRTDDGTLEMDNLKALFPHLSEDALENIMPICERYREEA